jgi:hypothetical protein
MTITDKLRQQITLDAQSRCGYCLVEAKYVYAAMEIDHLIPTAKGGSDTRENLWLACPRCNGFKSDQINSIDHISGQIAALFNPRYQDWRDHFTWDDTDHALIIGKTVEGRATIVALQINNEDNLAFRRLLVSAQWYPPNN